MTSWDFTNISPRVGLLTVCGFRPESSGYRPNAQKPNATAHSRFYMEVRTLCAMVVKGSRGAAYDSDDERWVRHVNIP